MADKITWNPTDEGPGRKRLETELISQDGTFVDYYFFFSYWPFLYLKLKEAEAESSKELASQLADQGVWHIHVRHHAHLKLILSMSWYSVSDDDEDDTD